jgi:hypothetical protein
MSVAYTRLTAPNPVTKHISLNDDGTLRKTATADALYSGEVEIRQRLALEGFAEELVALAPNQCFTYGLTNQHRARLMTTDAWQQAGRPSDVVTRTREHFHWCANINGIWMLDYDPSAESPPLTPDQLLAALYTLNPEIQQAPHVWRPSASSCIYHKVTGAEFRGIAGQRVYVQVDHPADIPRLGDLLHQRAWLNGYGRFDLSKSGSLLQRGLFDTAVWQPERIDFAAGALVDPPLIQRLPAPRLLGHAVIPLKSRRMPKLTPQEEALLQTQITRARHAMAAPAAARRAEYVASRATQMASERNLSLDQATDLLNRATDTLGGILMGDFPLIHQSGASVTVKELLDDPARWDGERFADPLDPEYRSDNRIARASLHGCRPFLFSHAHGGQRYTLARDIKRITLSGGSRHLATEAAFKALRESQSAFQRGGEIVIVGADGCVHPLKAAALGDVLGRVMGFEKFDGRNKKLVATDPPAEVTKAMLELPDKPLAKLVAVITAPILRLDGSLLDRAGQDAASGLYYHINAEQPPYIPSAPTEDQVRVAATELWAPFRLFPFATQGDRAVFFAALLTAAIRPILPTAPGFLITAPTAGTGKTLLARCLCALAGDASPSPFPPLSSANEDEMRKRLMAALRDAPPVLFVDNLAPGPFMSNTLAAMLTSPMFSDRILGITVNTSLPTRCLLVFTGNNVEPHGDLARRILECRVNADTESPHRRNFVFDPFDLCTRRRPHLIGAALTLLRAWHISGKQRISHDRLASFEDWDDWVRQTILWLIREDLAPVELADPTAGIELSMSVDADAQKHSNLLAAWFENFAANPRTTAEVIAHANLGQPFHPTPVPATPEARLYDAVAAVALDNRVLNTSRLGRWLGKYKERILDGKKIIHAGRAQGNQRWAVAQVGEGGLGGASF